MTEPFPAHLVLVPVSRWPIVLPDETLAVTRAMAASPGGLPRPLGVGATAPEVSIVVTTSSNLPFLTLCLRSVLCHGRCPSFEVVVVDNGSRDGTRSYLEQVSDGDPRVRPLFNDGNRSFAAATNQGVAAATGATLVLLNDDTLVPQGWLARLVRHLDDPAVGIVGAVSNRAGNEAQLDTDYRTYAEFRCFAADRSRDHAGELTDIRTVTMFCAGIRRAVWDRVGVLDERFEVGMFEDEDYAMRLRTAGWRVVCAEDSFVHHFGQATLGRLAATDQYGPLFHANRRRWEAKWGRPWETYRRRPVASYQRMVERLQSLVREVVPPDATVLVASKGDEDLLQLEGRRALHFPQTEDGAYTGYHPADSASAIRHLEDLRQRGGRYFLLPSSASWWLSHYAEFREHLEAAYSVAAREDVGVIFVLE